MHWSEKIAQDVIAKRPNEALYVVASGITPSGSVHIGNFREFITTYMVGLAIQKAGKRVRMIFSWDDFDRFRKVPLIVANRGYEQHIGKPVTAVPDAFGSSSSYAQHFEREFEDGLEKMGLNEIPVEFRYQSREYKSGRYNEKIIHALKKRKEIYDIITSFKTQGGEEGQRETYYPVSVYCNTCGKDFTTVTSFNEKNNQLEYTCKCGDTHKIDVQKADNIKLVWKVDWPMRWQAEGVVFEPGGPDHMTEGGSYDVSSVIARQIFGYQPPESLEFGFVGIKGAGVKMSSSKGASVTPAQLLNIYEPEIIRWLFAKYTPRDFFEFGFDDTIVRHYQEYDRQHDAAPSHLSFSTLATVAPLAGFNRAVVKKMVGHDGGARFDKVKYWLENYAPEKIYKLRDTFNADFFATMTATEKQTLEKLHEFLSRVIAGCRQAADCEAKQPPGEQDIQQFLYSIINDPLADKKINIAAQQRYFKIFYNMLFGRDDGPRLYLYLAVAPRDEVLKLLNC